MDILRKNKYYYKSDVSYHCAIILIHLENRAGIDIIFTQELVGHKNNLRIYCRKQTDYK
jgi:hypothetical protein